MPRRVLVLPLLVLGLLAQAIVHRPAFCRRQPLHHQVLMRVGRAASQLASTSTAAYGIDLPVPLSTRSSLKCEVDYLGMINFCLRPTDTALSGTSKTKLLNAVTNEVTALPRYVDVFQGPALTPHHGLRHPPTRPPGVPRPHDRLRPKRGGAPRALPRVHARTHRHQLLPRAQVHTS